MKSEFSPYVEGIFPSIIQMAAITPGMGVSGSDAVHSLPDVLKEVQTADLKDGDEEKKASITNDEIEEKDNAIQTLKVIFDEVGEACFNYLD